MPLNINEENLFNIINYIYHKNNSSP